MINKPHEVLQIGAGRIGRGLNGAVVSDSGYRITFADVNPSVVDLINLYGEYPVITVSSYGQKERLVRDVNAIRIQDEEAFTRAVVEADLILTAVGSGALADVAPHLAKGLAERFRRRPKDNLHAVVVACENITDNTLRLKKLVLSHVPEEYRPIIDEHVSFPNCVVDRIVPGGLNSSNQNPLAVTVEEYYQLVIDGNALRGPMIQVRGIEVSSNLKDILAQKLFTLNMAHAHIAYLGYRKGFMYVHEAARDRTIRDIVSGALQEVERVIVKTCPSIAAEAQHAYAKKVLDRFENPYLQDEVSRVARDPKRKLGPEDRLVAPAVLALTLGEIPSHLATGIVGALTYDNQRDEQAMELYKALRERGIDAVLQEVPHVPPKSPFGNLVRAMYNFDRTRYP
ncbi:MAG: mannitol-1-phosphate 5-dehydrogenase [Candidatus Aenigmarchaeota archaeon]|nr:mannitol-1-phosphate 5-dehydrogenase [Candidatus Aenigmarchaeota archaeon]